MSIHTLGQAKEAIAATIAFHRESLLAVSHAVAAYAKHGMPGSATTGLLVAEVERLTGITTDLGAGGLRTAFQSTCGTGDLKLTICARYDTTSPFGDGCGHNIIAAASLGAFVALVPLAEELGLTVRLFGVPIEGKEGGAAPPDDAREFSSSHVALMVRPAPLDALSAPPYLSNTISVRFTARDIAAVSMTEKSRAALDALTVAATAVGLARQQLGQGQDIYYHFTVPGDSPELISDRVEATWTVRSNGAAELRHGTQIVERCVAAAAAAIGCDATVSSQETSYYTTLLMDEDLLAFYRRNALAVGRDPLPAPDVDESTDSGPISPLVPGIHPLIGLGRSELRLHTTEFARAAVSAEGDTATLDGAILLAQTAADLAVDPTVRQRLLGLTPRNYL